jgi:nitroimidazol reductase NimA-like FMN-containing flavoprotein (pyridoxamine 5'-phosphate oxidase superfamily)
LIRRSRFRQYWRLVTDRDVLRMDEREIASVLDEGSRAQIATFNKDGSIHLVPMAYVMLDGVVTLWTDPSSRKVANLRADPRLTCLVELGEHFESFRAVQLIGTGSLITDSDASRKVGEALFSRTMGSLTDDVLGYIKMLSAQRVGIAVKPERVVSWDHRKLAGARPDQIGT